MTKIKDKYIKFGGGPQETNDGDIPSIYTSPTNFTPAEVGTEGDDKISAYLNGINSSLGQLQDSINNIPNINSLRTKSYFEDDFITGPNTSLGWQITQAGTGASAQVGTYGVNAIQKAVGVIQLDTGSTATGRAAISKSINRIVLGYGRFEQSWRFALEELSTPTDRFVVYAGLIDNTAAGAPVDGCYFVYSDSLSPNWLCVTRSNNTQTTVTTTVPADTSYNNFKIVVNTGGTEAEFFINDVLVATSTTNIPNTSARQTGIGLKIEKLIGTTQRNVSIDYYAHLIEIQGGR